MNKYFLFLLLLLLAACGGTRIEAVAPEPADDDGLEAEALNDEQASELPSCPADSGLEVTSNEAAGFCVAYPEDYCLWQGGPETQTTIVGGSSVRENPDLCQDPMLLHGSVVWVSVNVEPANGRSLEQVIAEYGAGGDISPAELGIEQSEVMLAGETAVQLDKAPAQDTQRLVFALHDDRLYQLSFVPATEDYGARYTEMLELYDVVMASFQFLGG